MTTGGASQVTIEHNSISGIPQSYGNSSNPTVISAGIWVGNSAVAASGVAGSQTATISDNVVSGGFLGIVVAPDSLGNTAQISGNDVFGFEKTGIDAGSFTMGGDGVKADISGNTVSGAGPGNPDVAAQNGVEIANGATGSIEGNHISGMIYTGIKSQATEATGIVVFESSGVSVQGNTIQDSQTGIAVQSAGYSSNQNDWTMQGDTVTGNTIGFTPTYQSPGVIAGETAGTWGIWVANYKAGATVSASVYGNDLTGANATAGGVPAVGIQVGDSQTGGAAGSVSATIAGNSVTGWTDGIDNLGTTGSGATFSSVASYNDLSGNAGAGISNLTGAPSGTTAVASLPARDNWWGSADGPTSRANTYDTASQGVAASGDVVVAPWLTQAPALGATSGATFAPVTDTTSGGQFSSIQAAVNAASAGDTVNVAPGTFSEGVSIGTPLTLAGAQHGVDARTRSGGESVITGSAGGPDVTVQANSVTLDGFTLQGPSSQGTAAIVMPGPYTGETVENNIIQDPGRAVSYTTSHTSFLQNLVRESGTTGDGIQENSGAVSHVTIQDNTFSGGTNNNADITFIGTTGSHNKDITVTGNTSTDPSTLVALFNTDTASITGNTVTGATGSAIYLGGGDSGITVQHNVISASGGPKYAVSVSDVFGDGPNSDIAVTFNALYGLKVGTAAYASGNVAAQDNWWGLKAGPASVTSGAVDAAPWLQELSISPPLVTSDVGAPLQWTASIMDSTGTAITDPAFAAAFATSGSATCQNQTSSAPEPFTTADVSFGCTPLTAGDLSITGTVSLDGTPLTLVGTAGLTAVTPSAPSGGGPTPSPTDGNLGSTITSQGGTTTMDVDAGHLLQNLGTTTDSTVTFTSTTPSTDVNLPGNVLSTLTQGSDGISLVTPGATYTLPPGSIDMAQLEGLLGVSQASDITLSISVTPATAGDTSNISQGLTNGSIVGDPVTFTITATANGQTKTIEVFTGAVPRTFTLGTTPNPGDTTGVVLVNGVPEHAWTVFSGTNATIYSRTDSTYAVVTNQVSFTDIAGLPQANAIQSLADKLVIAGTTPTTFDPQGGVTRAQFAALVVRALGLWNIGTSLKFPDVPASSWAAPVIRAAVAESFIQGYPDGTFRPQQQITNAQMAAIVARVMGFLKIGAGTAGAAPTDQAAIPAWATKDVALVLSQGIMTTSSDGSFAPGATTTRAQAAQIIWNLMHGAGIE